MTTPGNGRSAWKATAWPWVQMEKSRVMFPGLRRGGCGEKGACVRAERSPGPGWLSRCGAEFGFPPPREP